MPPLRRLLLVHDAPATKMQQQPHRRRTRLLGETRMRRLQQLAASSWTRSAGPVREHEGVRERLGGLLADELAQQHQRLHRRMPQLVAETRTLRQLAACWRRMRQQRRVGSSRGGVSVTRVGCQR
jgi:hypothetical protein